MDAISFVLGIKSSHLRSTHLRDLIYRGRKLRSNLKNGDAAAAATQSEDPKSAYVMAVYVEDVNGAAIEHRWKRSITASGASEYRINDKQVTAAQYNAALEKQEILIKARNFLIFQGEVEAIASQSPKDLTRLIEQISGSLEYKAEYERLKEEEKLAAETSAFNLNRRRGINAEIKQYQEQKKEAENYQQKIEERDNAVVAHVLWKLYHFQETMDTNKAEIERHQEELKELNRAHEKYARRLEDARTEHAKATKAVSKQEREIKRKEKELESRESELLPIDEKISISSDNLKKYANRIKEVTRDLNHQQATVDGFEKDLATVEKAQAKFEAEQQKIAAEALGTALSEADLQEYNRLKETVQTRTAAEQLRINEYTRQKRTDQETVEALKGKIDTSKFQLSKLQSELSDLKDRQGELKSETSQLSAQIEEKKKEMNSLTSERLRNEQKSTELNEKLHDCLQKLNEADSSRRESHRETKSKERAQTLKRIFPGVKGRLSELCKPRLKKYHEAVSTVLGRNWEAIVVDTEETAKACIDYLREQRNGQATFLPLDTIQVKPLNSSLKGMHRSMRMAIDTIEFDASVERAMLYACGNAIVCDDLKTAKYICYEKHIEVKAVTLDGTVIHKAGLMTGGKSGNAGRHFDDSEVEALKRLRENLMNQISALPKGRQGYQREESLQGELGGLTERQRYLKQELAQVDRTLELKTKEVKHYQAELKKQEPAHNGAVKSLDQLVSQLEELENTVSKTEDAVFAAFCERLGFPNIRDYEKRQGSLQEEAAQQRLVFTKQKSKLENQLVFERGRLRETQTRIEQLKIKSSRDSSLLSELEAEKSAIREALDSIEAELELMREELDTRRHKQEERAKHVADQKRELSKVDASLDEQRKSMSTLEAENDRIESQRYSILRRCKLEEIALPLDEDSEPLSTLPIDSTTAAHHDPDAMDIDADDLDDDSPTLGPAAAAAALIRPSFQTLPADLLNSSSSDEDLESSLLDRIKLITSDLSRMNPNLKAIDRLTSVETRLASTAADFEASKLAAKAAKDAFAAVKQKRLDKFRRAFDHIKSQIDAIYKELTAPPSLAGSSTTAPPATHLAGTAYLDLEDTDEPYLDGIKYHVQPPTKRFRDMEQLSGGEKTMAALALLFAVHSFQPSPFFVLDEVDAALDNANVLRIGGYIRRHAREGSQFVVISLKAGLFQRSEQLVGVYRDQVECSSRVLT